MNIHPRTNSRRQHGYTDGWSVEISRVVTRQAADGWSLPASVPDGRDMLEADLDALAEARTTGFEKRLAGDKPEGRACHGATAHRTRTPS